MYLRKTKTKNGRIHVSITQSYRNKDGKPTHKTIETLGYLDILAEKWKVSKEEVKWSKILDTKISILRETKTSLAHFWAIQWYHNKLLCT